MTKRLLFITPLFPKDSTEDNVVPFISQFTKSFSNKTKIEIDVLSLMYPFTKGNYKFENVTVYSIGGKFGSKINQIPTLLKSLLQSIKLQKKNNYDGILCFWYRETALVGYLLHKLFKIKLLIWLQGQDAKKSNLYVKLLNINSNNIIAISEHQRILFNHNFKKKVNQVANVSIDARNFPNLNTKNREIDIIGIGNLGALKNFSLFIDIINSLKTRNLNVLICGDGEEIEFLKTKVKMLKLEKNITFTGHVSNKKILNYLNNSKILLHTSQFEGAGLVLHEALFSGCKVVSTITIDSPLPVENFFHSNNLDIITSKIEENLNLPFVPKRIQVFTIEDCIDMIYNHFINFEKSV